MFWRRKLVFKLVFSYTIMAALLLGSIFSFFSYSYSRFIFREKENVYEQKLDIVSEQLNTDIKKIYSLHSQILASPSLKRLVTRKNVAGVESREVLENLKHKYTGVRAIYLYDKQGKILDYAADSLAAPPDVQKLAEFMASKAYRSFCMQADQKLIFYGALYLENESGYQYQYEAYTAVVLDPARLFYNTNNKARETFDSVYVFADEKVVAREGKALNEELVRQADSAGQFQEESGQYVAFRQRNAEYAEWELVAMVDYSIYGREVWQLTILLFLLAVLSVCLILLISFFISKKITSPIMTVNKAMAQVEKGEFPAPLQSQSSDETNDLIQGFNHMIESLEKLSEEIAREQEEKRRYEVEKVKAQLELLQSQVNPHFIHNTLNALKYMALSAGNTELASTITSFNSLLRASISTNTEYTTVEEECHYVMEYMNIQKKRYASSEITCTAHVDRAASQGLLPRLILQPLVENSLFHGILPLEGKPGSIKVVCFVDQGFLHVYITDNGIGIPEEKLKKMNEGELRVTNGYNHVGLNNVKERLNLMYRTDCKFIITSEYHSGTTIYFRVPYKEEMECIPQ